MLISAIPAPPDQIPPYLAERHFTVPEIATLWNISQSKVRELFTGEPGVIRIGKPTRRVAGRWRRTYTSTRISASALLRVHRRLTANGWYARLATERHFKPEQLQAWGFSSSKIRRMLADEAGMMWIGSPTHRSARRYVRRYFTARVPEPVAKRIYERLTQLAVGVRAPEWIASSV